MNYEENNKKFLSWIEEPLEKNYHTYSNNIKKIEKERVCLNGCILKKRDYIDNLSMILKTLFFQMVLLLIMIKNLEMKWHLLYIDIPKHERIRRI